MASVIVVDDPRDERLVEVAGLTDAAARSRVETRNGCFVIEGLRTLRVALRSGAGIRSVLVSERKLDRVLDVVDSSDCDVFVGSQSLLEDVTGFAIHRGVVASASRGSLPRVGDQVANAHRLVVVEGLNDHENMGALFRNAAAFGVDAVFVDPTTADPLYRRSVRVSLGHVLRVPWTRLDPLPGGLGPLRDAGFRTVALTPDAETSVHDLEPVDRLAWIVGAEGPGLGGATLGTVDVRARIPIADGVDSLNVATAAAVAFALDPGRP